MIVNKKVGQSKKAYIEALRIIACFFVIYNHTDGFHLYLSGNADIRTVLEYCVSALTKMSVPIFFMISGSLLLAQDKSKKRRIIEILSIIFISNIMVYIKNNINSCLNIKDFIESLFAGTVSVGYWYLYAYLAALIMLPFLRDIVKQLDIRKFRYLMVLHFLFCTIMPLGVYIAYNLGINIELNGNFSVPFATQNSIFYMLVGFYIDNKIDIYAFKKSDFIKWGIITMSGVVTTAVFTCHQGVKYGFSQNFFQCVDYLIAIFMFLFIKWVFKSKAQEWINILGSVTFGIYLMEPFFRIYIYRYIMKYISQNIPKMLFSMLYSFIAMIIVGSITYMLKYIPGIKKLI